MILKFFAGGFAVEHGFFFVPGFGVEFDVEPFFQGPDDEKAGPAVEDDTVGGSADNDFGPVSNFG